MDHPVIQVQNLSKIYNKGGGAEVQAVRDVSLEIVRGEFVGIMGASGSGKSSLMNILGCLDKPTSGTVLLDGIDVSGLNDEELARVRNRKIGFVFQTFNLLPRTNALENVELPLIYSDRPGASKLARKALESVGLGSRMHHSPSELSGGEQQRVAIARALVNDPEIIFADEPTGNLDSRSSYEIMALFQKLNASGRTLVVITHERDIAEHTRRIIRIADGRIVEDIENRTPRDAGAELAKLPPQEDRDDHS
jgi:putative ABC transport system ATP-binding protein